MREQEFEAILVEALHPAVDDREAVLYCRPHRKGQVMKMKHIVKKVCILAAAVALLTTTAYAAGGLNIKTLVSGMRSRAYNTVAQAEEAAGFEMDDLSHFANGYAVDGIRVEEVRGMDEKDRVCLTYNEICVELKNTAGERLHLSAYQDREGLEASSLPADQIRKVEEAILEYRLHHYKFVPADYVLTEADKMWLQQPGNFMSYGSETVEENDVAFLNWERDGICYTLMDSDGSEPADSLFAMAEELIFSNQ